MTNGKSSSFRLHPSIHIGPDGSPSFRPSSTEPSGEGRLDSSVSRVGLGVGTFSLSSTSRNVSWLVASDLRSSFFSVPCFLFHSDFCIRFPLRKQTSERAP